MLLPMLDRDTLVRRFSRGDAWFDTSPLYQVLSRAVAADDALLDLAAEARPGQQPANMLMAATHLLVLKDPGLPFARFFASVRGDEAESPEGAGTEFTAFCAEHRDELTRILRERLVQTNAPGRGVAVRLAMHEIGRRVHGPVTFLEIGPSAGIQLRFERWAVHTGGRRFGPPDAPLTLSPEWRLWSCSTPWSVSTSLRTAGPTSIRRSPRSAGGGARALDSAAGLTGKWMLAYPEARGRRLQGPGGSHATNDPRRARRAGGADPVRAVLATRDQASTGHDATGHLAASRRPGGRRARQDPA